MTAALKEDSRHLQQGLQQQYSHWQICDSGRKHLWRWCAAELTM